MVQDKLKRADSSLTAAWYGNFIDLKETGPNIH